MFFEVWCRIFVAGDNFQATFVDFRFMIFTKVLMKELARFLIHAMSIKSSTVRCPSKFCFQCASQLLKRNFNIAVIK